MLSKWRVFGVFDHKSGQNFRKMALDWSLTTPSQREQRRENIKNGF